ncbi:response regulator [Paenibacillus sp. Marseille-Q4541]|uniref:response regulator n=1 Tax=Paenibacillus sp. Marseille-Q4541 TaxID=2831522 RepID=UPI001BAE3DB9|nr:response regulator [Paenibacillus sp. Marseille-Q4541]
MYKMLIVDDEQIERSALRMMIERHLPEVLVVGEAENGRIAVEMAHQLRPDVVTMDVKMPGIDGIEAVSLLCNEYPDMQFIMVSAFDEFEYARRVMKYGVKEYLLKPCKKDQMISAVKTVLAGIDVSRQDIQREQERAQQVQQACVLIEAEWVAAICQERAMSEETKRYAKDVGIKENSAGYAMVFAISSSGTMAEEQQRLIQNEMRGYMKTFEGCHIGPAIGGYFPCLFFPPDKEEGAGRRTIRSQASHMARFLLQQGQRGHGDIKVSIGIGNLYSSATMWVRSYHEALLASQISGKSAICFYEDIPMEMDDDYPYPHESEQQLLQQVRRGNGTEAEEVFDDYLSELLRMTNYDLERVKHDLGKLFSQMLKLLKEKGILLPKLGGLSALKDEQSLRTHAQFQLKLMLEKLNEMYRDEQRGSIEKAKTFMAEYYVKELSLEEVAEHIGLNPHYFSKMFHERCGVTFIDYLTSLRIGKAQELLADPKQVVKEISVQIGYRDPNYFSRVFKKMVGVSPSEYRNACLRNEMLGL